MRTAETKIKEAILHPVEEIRWRALAYFERAFTEDTDVMPLVIQAVEKYGPDSAARLLQWAETLPQTQATIQWLVDELSKEWDLADIHQDNYCFAIGSILCHAPVEFLRAEMTELARFPEELRDGFLERLDMLGWDWDTGWAALKNLAGEVSERGGYRRCDVRREQRIVEALSRHRDRASGLLALLRLDDCDGDPDLMGCLEYAVVELAGWMRLEDAVPLLVERLGDDDQDLADVARNALARIGTDSVVGMIAERWSTSDRAFRIMAADVLESIHSDLNTKTCLELLRAEAGKHEDIAEFLAEALLAQFAPESIEPVRQLLFGWCRNPHPIDIPLAYTLVAACTVMGTTFPEYEEWYRESIECRWGWGDDEPERLRQNFLREFEDDDFDDEEWDDQFGDDYDEDDYDEDDEDEDGDEYDEDEYDEDESFNGEDFDALPPLEPIRNTGPAIGRNDPCPCGSGKKYKKCCLKSGRYEPDAS